MTPAFPRRRATLFCCLSLALVASTAHAADTDDRVTLRLGAMNVDAQGELRGSTVFEGNDLAFSEDFDFGSKEWVPRVDGVFRMGERQRLIFDYFQYDKSQRATLSEDLSYDDVTIPAGSFAKGEDVGANRYALSLGMSYRVDENSTLKVEYRLDGASQPVFSNAAGTAYSKTNHLLGASMVVSF